MHAKPQHRSAESPDNRKKARGASLTCLERPAGAPIPGRLSTADQAPAVPPQLAGATGATSGHTALGSGLNPPAQLDLRAAAQAVFIDLTSDDDEIIDGSGVVPGNTATESAGDSAQNGRPSAGLGAILGSGNRDRSVWVCQQCTLANAAEAAHCSACGRSRPLGRLTAASAGAFANASGAPTRPPAAFKPAPVVAAGQGVGKVPGGASTGINAGEAAWECKFCTLANPRASTRCGACEQWRFASGARARDLV